jgi:pimeloyl-ACP methyl ester carboxylesterase
MISREFTGFNGLTLKSDCFGDPGSKQCILLAHGGGQTRHAWQSTAKQVAARGHYAVALDLRGHGDSDWAPDGDYSIDAFANDLLLVSAQLASRPILIGASLGGIASMIAAGEIDRAAFSAVIFVDITPTMEPAGVEKVIAFMSDNLAEGFESLEAAAATISNYMPHRKPPENLDGLKKNLRLGRDGRYRWHWDPAFIQGTMRPSASRDPSRLCEAVKAIKVRQLLIRGKMSELVSENAVREYLNLVPHAGYVDVSDAGHMIAGDSNEVFTQAVLDFIQSTLVAQ